MTTVFIAGSINIKNLDPKVKERINNIVASDFEVVVGDAGGADTSIQEYLLSLERSRTTVFCSGSAPRNNLGHWPARTVDSKHSKGSRAFFTEKDVVMAEAADYGLMIWDAKSTGTLSNVIELLSRKKKSLVFVNKEKQFKVVGDVSQLEELIAFMSDHAKQKANEKIKLFDRISLLKHDQAELSF
ncbi:hypothetical protein D3C87_912900 [compost metagenome]|jgi:hypothetical protein|uniref:Uncharacterized protein n=2 Tax=Pseudomonas TaxID=286 RepID=A0A423N9M9_PSEFL|nr:MULTISPECIES: hypothetical protein [Pseudomonas]EJM07880.1 hypothetical protein PMI19_00495 [Pseudomonas sp. GM16]EJM44953.1 hypothetical protein PMI23_00689 [Pseudomonas sp. GM24]MDD1000339.1 hypothetical protein [Pseudomonas sp. TNT2022 ID642]RON94921.1 hypothetical protein BK672_11805 [Pseudomonas fluorescens]TDV51847.1 hypothetical protein EDF87_102358 [Pseudomonas helmanticensis]